MNAEEIKLKLEEFDKRWDITDNTDYEREINKFRIRLSNFMNEYYKFWKPEYVKKYADIWGIMLEQLYKYSPLTSQTLIIDLMREKDEIILYKKIQSLFYIFGNENNKFSDEEISITETIYRELLNIINYSNLNLSITKNNNFFILYPKGEKELDEKLVNEVLKFLNQESQKHFVEALKFYLEGTDRSYIKAAESLRRTIEEFIRFKLQNSKGLDANIKELGAIHKKDGKDKQIRNVINNVFDYLDSYFNENSKHQDGDIDETECEYLIYQTGVLLRYINKLKVD
jgi:hypothetical protein